MARNTSRFLRDVPEKELDSKEYIPTRYPLDGWGGVGGNCGNDNTGGRSDRFTAGVAFLMEKRLHLSW